MKGVRKGTARVKGKARVKGVQVPVTKTTAAKAAMTDDELNAEVDRLLTEELAKRRTALRLEIIYRERAKAAKAHLDWVNRRRPEDDPPTPAEEAARDAQLEKSRAAMREKLAANDARFAAEEQARLKVPQRPGTLPGTGAEGFEVKR